MNEPMQSIQAAITENGRRGEFVPVALTRIGDDAPLVSCLMVSRGRLFPACYAIACFQKQTYANRELVVVIDDPASELLAYIADLKDARIRIVAAWSEAMRPEKTLSEKMPLENAPPEKTTLGELRNISVASARGDYVCQWDDDDLHAPERIRVQLAGLLTMQASVCVLWRWTLWWPGAERLAISGARMWEGTILAAKNRLLPYPALRRGEDTAMLASLLPRERILSIDAPELYVYIHHGNNAFSQRHYLNIYNFSKQRWIGTAYWAQFEKLSQTLPLRAYLESLSPVRASQDKNDGMIPALPLVSIIVRSMGRPELRLALESLAAQDYPALDIIVVDATGGDHPPLPAIAWRPGHGVRMVGGQRRLPRPHAANCGLDAVRGAWFGFLDDDDSFDADHISVLMKAAVATHDLVVYGLTRQIDCNGEVVSVSGHPFNRATMFHDAILCFPTALIRRSVLRLGCRFDERFDISEDRDFFLQIARHSDFTHVPHVSFNYGVELGTSGTGRGNNRDIARLIRFEQLLRCKWLGIGYYHVARAAQGCKRGILEYGRGDMAAARVAFDKVLSEYPDDPNALNGRGYLALAQGDLAVAERLLWRAVEINPSAGEYRLNLATALERAGELVDARAQASLAASDPSARETALQLLSRLGGVAPRLETSARPVATQGARTSRMEKCPCGSGKRYKHCCGEVAAVQHIHRCEADAQRAVIAFQSGAAFAALAIVEQVPPAELTVASTALACGEICAQMARYEDAYGYFRRAAELGETASVAAAVTRAFQQCYRRERDASTRETAAILARRFSGRALNGHATASQEVHIIASLDQLGGSEHRALALFALLAQHSRVRIWSVAHPWQGFAERVPIGVIDESAGKYPRSGHLVFVGPYFEYGRWLMHCQVHRVTLCYNVDDPGNLIERLVELEDIPGAFLLDFTFPSRGFRDLVGIDGRVEYPMVDLRRFSATRSRAMRAGPLVIGRHSRDDRLKYHPNDPAFFRRLAGLGHQVMVAGGTCLSGALSSDGAMASIRLLPEAQDGLIAFLDSLDCFIYRIHPHWFETGGTVILEAMAMGLPVVLFGEGVGMAEVIEHQRNGFIVATEDEAIACIEALAHDPDLRHEMGLAARNTVMELMDEQADAARDFYLPESARNLRGVSMS